MDELTGQMLWRVKGNGRLQSLAQHRGKGEIQPTNFVSIENEGRGTNPCRRSSESGK